MGTVGVDAVAGGALLLYLLILGFVLLLALGMYILNGVAYMRIAQKVGVQKGWFAFIPVASDYLLGLLAEKNDEVYDPNGKHRKWSKLLLIGSIGFWVIYLVVIVSFLLLFITAGVTVDNGTSDAVGGVSAIFLILGIFLWVLLMIAAFYLMVVGYIINYKNLHLMAPDYAIWILLASILITPLVTTVAIMIFAFSSSFPKYQREERAWTTAGTSYTPSQPAVQPSQQEQPAQVASDLPQDIFEQDE